MKIHVPHLSRKAVPALGLILLGALPSISHAAVVVWADWTAYDTGTGVATGTLNGSTITYSNGGGVAAMHGAELTGTATNIWDEPIPADRPYTDNAVIDNAPSVGVQNSGVVQLDKAATHTLTIDTATVSNLVMTLISVGSGNTTTLTYDFDRAFTFLSDGVGHFGAATATPTIDESAGTIVGQEWSGAIQFEGALASSGGVSTLTWTTNVDEDWSGFTVGVVPEPSTYALFAGMVALSVIMTRRTRR